MAGGVSRLARGLFPSSLTPLPWLEGSAQQEGSTALPEDLFLPFPLTPLPRLEGSPWLEGSTWLDGSAGLPEDLFLPSSLTPLPLLEGLAVSLVDIGLSAPLTLSLWLEGLPEDLAFAAPPTFPPLAADFCLCACFSPVVEDKMCQHSTDSHKSPHIRFLAICMHTYMGYHQMRVTIGYMYMGLN